MGFVTCGGDVNRLVRVAMNRGLAKRARLVASAALIGFQEKSRAIYSLGLTPDLQSEF